MDSSDEDQDDDPLDAEYDDLEFEMKVRCDRIVVIFPLLYILHSTYVAYIIPHTNSAYSVHILRIGRRVGSRRRSRRSDGGGDA